MLLQIFENVCYYIVIVQVTDLIRWYIITFFLVFLTNNTLHIT